MFEGETNILRKTLVIHAGNKKQHHHKKVHRINKSSKVTKVSYIITGADDLTPDGDGVGNAGARIACGLILEPSDEGMGITILIIILVVVAILVIALLICICCYYCKR